MIAYLSKTVGQ